ncbi:hypothetical protein PV08_01642 [Exophiala spinifera]|uniref:Urease accessory protein UreD n=1 Tax=Exophiala spinifera TaxID=91928 RepID=A0A0D2BQ52_9EURO|nr:uncharacterized protein PV08_01642 [Exophiala spinifera]KIW21063.1 hypothetical protein PV08_01642 [Exophiala spinifera]
MSLPQSPFAPSTSVAGAGEIVLSLLPPGRQALQVFKYQYPLKLIAPEPHSSGDDRHVTIAFLLTYGGGLVGGDQVNLKVELQKATRLVLLTQGSTKLFKAPHRSVVSKQTLDVKIGPQAALCYLPDPTQPFAESVYEQKQTFYVEPDGTSSLLMLDWVSEGRRALGESWTLWSWKGRNEVREFDGRSRGRLLIRDAVILHEDGLGGMGLVDKADNMAIFGTLIVYGTRLESLAEFLVKEFANQPRIGAKNWTQEPVAHAAQAQQTPGLLWTVARVRGFVLVKFGAKDLDGARHWLGDLLKQEGTVEQLFGHQALMCLR